MVDKADDENNSIEEYNAKIEKYNSIRHVLPRMLLIIPIVITAVITSTYIVSLLGLCQG